MIYQYYRNRNVWMLWKQHIVGHTHMSAYYYSKRILVLALSTQNATASVFLLCFTEPRLYQNYRRKSSCHPIFSRFNEQTRMLTYIHEFLREGCAALYYTLYLFSSFEWYMWLSYIELRSHVLMCICGSLSFILNLASGRDLSTSMLPFLGIMDCLLHIMLACRDVPKL